MDITNLLQGVWNYEALYFAGSAQNALGMVTVLNFLASYVVILFFRKKITQAEFVVVLGAGFVLVNILMKLFAGGH